MKKKRDRKRTNGRKKERKKDILSNTRLNDTTSERNFQLRL